MASTTKTVTIAQSSAPTVAHLGVNVIAGSNAGLSASLSASASAVLLCAKIPVTNLSGPHMGPVYQPTWDDSAGDSVKYVQCSVGSGTVAAAFVVDYQITFTV